MKGHRNPPSDLLDKCVGTGCERRAECVRFRSLVQGQAVLNPPPLKRVSQACAYFHPIGVMATALMLTLEEAAVWAADTTAKPTERAKVKRQVRSDLSRLRGRR